MIGLNRLKRAISDVPTCGMQTGSPKVKLDLSDAHRIIAEMEQLEREKAELVARVEYVKSHFNELIEVAQRCDSWESFPQKSLDRAFAALESLPDQCLNQIKAEAVLGAVRYCNHYMAFPVSRGSVADKVISVDEAKQYAASIAKGE